jgi:hypothetical protein
MTQDSKWFAYLLPDEAEHETLFAAYDKMPDEFARQWDIELTEHWCVDVHDDNAAVYARCRYSEAPYPTGDDGIPGPDQIACSTAQRPEVEEMLRTECPSSATWWRIAEAYAPPEVHHAFQQAFAEVMARRT